MKLKPPFRITQIISGVVIVAAILAFAPIAQAQKAPDNRSGKLFGGAAVGFQTDTADSTAFALGVYGDYYLSHNVSIGPLLQMGFTDDLFQLGLSAQAKYTFDIPNVPKFKPHIQAGIGFVHADLDEWYGGSKDDTSILIPLGVGAEYKLSNSISLDGAILVNFNDLDYRDGDTFVTWFFGIKFLL